VCSGKNRAVLTHFRNAAPRHSAPQHGFTPGWRP
jgi:hypothetical protein